MKKRVKIVLALITVVITIVVGMYLFLMPTPMEAVQVQPKDALLYLTEHGFMESGREDYILSPEVSGKVLQTYVAKDSIVAVGELILELDASGLESQRQAHEALIRSYQAQIAGALQSEQTQKEDYLVSIRRLEEELNSIEGQRKSADARRAEAPSIDEQIALLKISLEQQELQIAYTQERLTQAEILAEAGIIPKIDVQNLQQELSLLQKNLASVQEQHGARVADRDKIKKEETKITLSEEGDKQYYDALTQSVTDQIYAFHDKLTRNTSQSTVDYYNALIQSEYAALTAIDPGKYRLTSPITGTILELPAQNQSVLAAMSPAAIIRPHSDDSALKASTYVSTRDIDSLKIDQEVQLVRKLRDQDVIIPGVICEIASTAETRISALGIEERRVKVSVLPNANHPATQELKSGFDVDIRFILVNQPNKLLVPSSALFKHNGTDSVFKIVDGIAMISSVTTGIKTSSEIVLEEGLVAGDIVVIDPNNSGLREGSRQEPILR